MSTLYYHIIVKYFHIEDEMPFKNEHHKTSWHPPLENLANQKYTYMWIEGKQKKF